MDQAAFPQYSFAMLLEPAVVQAAAERAAKLDLPRRICRPLDRRVVVAVDAEVAAYDATVEATAISEE
jgi:cob(I)alamin adenosyltransferase